jgi:hypothetical protein
MSKSLLQLATDPVVPSERTVEAWCDDLIARLAGKTAIVRRSPPHRSAVTKGIPDRRYRVLDTAFDFEVKAPDGALSDEQIFYLREEGRCGSLAACGGVNELSAVIAAIRHEQRTEDADGYALDVCRRLVDEWVEKRDADRRAIASRKAERESKRAAAERLKAERAADRERRRAFRTARGTAGRQQHGR